MPNFFDFLGRIVAGKPVFETEQKRAEQPQPPAAPASATPQSAIRKHDAHTFPVLEVRRVTTHISGTTVQIYCHIRNMWQEEIMLDKIRLLDTRRELDTFLRGGEEREFLVYKGPLLQKEVREAQIDYKTVPGGDYFQAVYEVMFTFNPVDKTYTIGSMHLRLPIRDIYE